MKKTKALPRFLAVLAMLLGLGIVLSRPAREQQTGAGQKPPEEPPTQYEKGLELNKPMIAGNPNYNAMFEPSRPEPEPPADPRITRALRMTENIRFDDFPAIASNPRNRDVVYAVWLSYSGQQDQLRLAEYRAKDQIWGQWNPVPGVSGDVWRPSLAFDAKDRVWVIWSQQVDGNFDLYARWFDGTYWGPLERLTNAAGSDFDQRVVSTRDGRMHVVWQGFRQGQSDIFYIQGDGSGWSRPLRVSTSDWNDWEPAVAAGADGTAYVVWDTYERNDYDVMLRTVRNGELSAVRTVAATPRFEARPTIALDRDARVWIAYETGPMNWGKDQGAIIMPVKARPGTPLLEERQVEVVCLDGNRVLAPGQNLSSLLAPSDLNAAKAPPVFVTGQLIADDEGRIHMLFHQKHGRGSRVQFWREWIATMTPEGWDAPAVLPSSRSRASMRGTAAPAPGGKLWLAWASDNQPGIASQIQFPQDAVVENVYTALYAPKAARTDAKLVPFSAPTFEKRPPAPAGEREQVAAIRDYEVTLNGKRLRILRGYLHRHTELSLDLRSIPDGSFLDYYRYMLDVASMDFGARTDHNAGADREYWWWLGQKTEDLFHAPERYIALFGYERSVQYPYGHRNVIYDTRGRMVFPFVMDKDFAFRLYSGTGRVLEGDTPALYEEVARGGGITIPHTSATEMGTDWRDNDPNVEPLVEIYQGDRFSSEHKGAPLAYPEGGGTEAVVTGKIADRSVNVKSTGAVREKGFIWNAWAKGYRIGVIASSDHISTHMSYAMVLAEERTRRAVLDAMKKRRAYAATDNIILEFWLGDHIMGEEFTASKVPQIRVKAIGTAEIDNIQLVRNNQYIYKAEPRAKTAQFTYEDQKPQPGLNYYYVRVVQKDGNAAWSSPIWVNLFP